MNKSQIQLLKMDVQISNQHIKSIVSLEERNEAKVNAYDRLVLKLRSFK